MVVDLSKVQQGTAGNILTTLRSAASQNHAKLLQPLQVKMALAMIEQVAADNYNIRMMMQGLQNFYNFVEAEHAAVIEQYVALIEQDSADVDTSFKEGTEADVPE